jgi:hypothetical protein
MVFARTSHPPPNPKPVWLKVVDAQGWRTELLEGAPVGSAVADCASCGTQQPVALFVRPRPSMSPEPLCVACATKFLMDRWPHLQADCSARGRDSYRHPGRNLREIEQSPNRVKGLL